MVYKFNCNDLTKDELIAMARYVVKHHNSRDDITYYFDDVLYTYLGHDEHGIKCDHCGEMFKPSEIVEMLDENGNVLHRCHSCNDKLYSFFKCPICGKYHLHHGRFEELTLTPTLNNDDSKKYGIYKDCNSEVPVEKLEILKDFGFSDDAIETIRKYYGMHICHACAEKHGIRDTRGDNGCLEDGMVYMKGDAIKDPMTWEECKELKMNTMDSLFNKLGIEEFAKTKYSNPQVRTKSILVKLINQCENDK